MKLCGNLSLSWKTISKASFSIAICTNLALKSTLISFIKVNLFLRISSPTISVKADLSVILEIIFLQSELDFPFSRKMYNMSTYEISLTYKLFELINLTLSKSLAFSSIISSSIPMFLLLLISLPELNFSRIRFGTDFLFFSILTPSFKD